MKRQNIVTASLLLSLLGLPLLHGCSGDSEVSAVDTTGPNRELITEADQIQEAVTQGRLLRSSSERDRNGLTSSLRDARSALIRLARNKTDRLGIELGHRALKELERLYIIRGDMGVLNDFYRDLGNVVSESARAAGIVLDDLAWTQFSYAFSDDVAPFATQTTGPEWSTGVSLDKSYIRVKQSGKTNQAWLISPSFDLTNMTNPGFKITHNTSMEKNDRFNDPFNRVLVNQTVFKVMVSTKYQDGDALKLSDWTDISSGLGVMPTGVDFHTVESSVVDLSKYISENTVVAFVFNEDTKTVGRQYLSWQINKFELVGAGELKAITPRAKPLLVTEIDDNQLAPFVKIPMSAEAPAWEYFQIGTSPKFAKISANSKEGESWLLSPKYKLAGADSLSLVVKEVVRNPKFDQMEILISTDYEGGDPSLSNWEKLERPNTSDIPAGAWTDVVSGPFDLAKYFGSEVVVALKLTSHSGDNHDWEIASLSFVGEGDEIAFERYKVTFDIPGDIPGDSSSAAIASFNFNYGAEGFTAKEVSGTPAEFKLTSRDNRQYYNISGFKPRKEGVVRLVSPLSELKVEAGKKVALKVTQNYNFYKSEDQAKKKLLKIFIADEAGTEEEVLFTQVPSGDNFDIITSEDLVLADSWIGKKAQVIFEYATGDNVFPSWSIYDASFIAIEKK